MTRSASADTAPGTASAQHSGPRPVVLLGSQLVFNIGFFAVVPFLAGVLRDDFALAGAAVGLVLGARTAAQQGLFLFGGALADRFGARALILSGCAVRVCGFALLAWSTADIAPAGAGLGLFIAGTLLTGMGGALFSPALEVMVARAEAARTGSGRTTLFALLAVFGEVGAAIGPVLGAVLLGWGFAAVAASGAVLFILVAGALALLLPRGAQASSGMPRTVPHDGHLPRAVPQDSHTPRAIPQDGPAPRASAADPDAPHDGHAPRTVPQDGHAPRAIARDPHPPGEGRRLFAVLADRRFMALAALASVNLFAYNQLYLGFPVELRRAGLGDDLLAVVFVVVSVLTVILQLPLARLVHRQGERATLRLGYLLLSAAFAALAIAAPLPVPTGVLAVAPALVSTVLLTLGHLVLGPLVLSLVPRFAPASRWGSYYGMLATCGGVSVLLGNIALGSLYPLAAQPSPAALVPWLVLAVLPLLPALIVPRLLPPAAPSHRPATTHPSSCLH